MSICICGICLFIYRRPSVCFTRSSVDDIDIIWIIRFCIYGTTLCISCNHSRLVRRTGYDHLWERQVWWPDLCVTSLKHFDRDSLAFILRIVLVYIMCSASTSSPPRWNSSNQANIVKNDQMQLLSLSSSVLCSPSIRNRIGMDTLASREKMIYFVFERK